MAYEEFNRNQLEKLNEIYDFLGVDRVENFQKEHINKSKECFRYVCNFNLEKCSSNTKKTENQVYLPKVDAIKYHFQKTKRG